MAEAMMMRIVQAVDTGGDRGVVAVEDGNAWWVEGARTTYELAVHAMAANTPIAELVRGLGRTGPANPRALLETGQVLAAIDHPDPAHLTVSGTGLTHI